MHSQIDIRTDGAGLCRAEVFGEGPGVLMFHDGLGMRPAMHDIARQIAGAGYCVLLPDLFYRMAPYEAPDAKALFSDPAVRAAWWTKAQGNTAAAILGDVPHYLAALKSRARGSRIGATGYCMGGRLALSAAGKYPDAFAAVAAYHPGGLVTDTPDSPHLLFDKITAQVYFAAASDDPSLSDAHRDIVIDAFVRGAVDHVVEVYPAKHGWVPTDTPVHDETCAARHRDTLFNLLRRTL